VSWLGKLKKAEAEIAARDADPWRLRLERLHDKISDNGIARITTQAVFDILEIPQQNRSASACRRLAKLMTEHCRESSWVNAWWLSRASSRVLS
jgi:hypothetical protein